MQISKMVSSRLVTVAAGAAIVGLVGAGAGWSAAQITSADIANDSIRSKDVRDGTLKTKDLSKKTVNTLTGRQGPAGPQGPQGPAGNGEVVVSATGGSTGWELRTQFGPVALTPDGVRFGPYADAGNNGGTVCFNGLNGQKVSALKGISYYERHVVDNPASFEGYAAPYFRIFIGNDAHDIVYSPNTQNTIPGQAMDVDANEFNEQVVTQGSVRYDDDAENGPDSPWATLVAAHGNEVIGGRGVCITQGFSAGANASALLRWIQINDKVYRFRSAS